MANEGKKCATYFFSPKTSLQKIIVTFAVFLLLGSEPQSVTGGLSTHPAVLQQTDQLSDFLSTFFSQKCHDDRIRLFDNCFLILGQFFSAPTLFSTSSLPSTLFSSQLVVYTEITINILFHDFLSFGRYSRFPGMRASTRKKHNFLRFSLDLFLSWLLIHAKCPFDSLHSLTSTSELS